MSLTPQGELSPLEGFTFPEDTGDDLPDYDQAMIDRVRASDASPEDQRDLLHMFLASRMTPPDDPALWSHARTVLSHLEALMLKRCSEDLDPDAFEAEQRAILADCQLRCWTVVMHLMRAKHITLLHQHQMRRGLPKN